VVCFEIWEVMFKRTRGEESFKWPTRRYIKQRMAKAYHVLEFSKTNGKITSINLDYFSLWLCHYGCHYGWTHEKLLPLCMPFLVCAWIYHVFWWKANWSEEFSYSYSNSRDLHPSPLIQELVKTIFCLFLTKETQHTIMEKPSW
jgi:hypothetical protein